MLGAIRDRYSKTNHIGGVMNKKEERDDAPTADELRRVYGGKRPKTVWEVLLNVEPEAKKDV